MMYHLIYWPIKILNSWSSFETKTINSQKTNRESSFSSYTMNRHHKVWIASTSYFLLIYDKWMNFKQVNFIIPLNFTYREKNILTTFSFLFSHMIHFMCTCVYTACQKHFNRGRQNNSLQTNFMSTDISSECIVCYLLFCIKRTFCYESSPLFFHIQIQSTVFSHYVNVIAHAHGE